MQVIIQVLNLSICVLQVIEEIILPFHTAFVSDHLQVKVMDRRGGIQGQREGGDEGMGGGSRGGGRMEKRGQEEGEEGAGEEQEGEGRGEKKGREEKRGKFCAHEARAAPEGRRETRVGGRGR